MRSISSYITPEIGLAVLLVLITLDVSLVTVSGQEVSEATTWIWSIAFALLLAWWVRSDRKTRDYATPFEHDAFVFFAWPVVVPYYLYRTRGRKGLLCGIGICALYVLPFLVAAIARSVIK